MQAAAQAAQRVRFVLVEPRESRNIGAVCRAMKTMGFRNLYVVGTEPVDREQAAVTAVHAADLLDRAVFCGELQEAVRDAVLVAGISRRRGRKRKYFAIDPQGLARRAAGLRSGICAVVFGNEAAGLSDRDLQLCHLAVQIPTAPQFPSLNLSHAVQVIAYELFRHLGGAAQLPPDSGDLPLPGNAPGFQPISATMLEDLVALIIGALRNVGFFTRGDPEELGVFWRDILARATLERREADRLAEIFGKISGMVAGRKIDP
jgi:tRNA/rRNA methyltransferase